MAFDSVEDLTAYLLSTDPNFKPPKTTKIVYDRELKSAKVVHTTTNTPERSYTGKMNLDISSFLPDSMRNDGRWAADIPAILARMVSSNGFFNDLIVDESSVNSFVAEFQRFFGLSAVGNLRSAIIGGLCGKINDGIHINVVDDVRNILVDFSRKNTIESLLGFEKMPDNPDELSPTDLKELLVDCLDKIYNCVDAKRSNAMKSVLFREIMPTMFEATMSTMTFLEELDGEEFQTLFDELDEFGYTFVTAMSIFEGMYREGTTELVRTKCGHATASEYSTFIKYVYEGSLSPWCFMMDFISFQANFDELIKTSPKAVLSGIAEWKENFRAVNLTRGVTNENMLAVKRFLCI
jgi:hypothetical protein